MRRPIPLAAACLLLLAAPALAADADDVRAAMKKNAEQVGAGKYLEAFDGYYTVNDGEREMARAMIETDAATGKLENAVRRKLGDKGWDEMAPTVHAVPREGGEAIRVKVEGDVATVTWPGEDAPLLLRKVGGAWKISVPDIMKWAMKQGGATEAQARDLEGQVLEVSVDRVRRIASGLSWLALEVEAGKYPSADAVKTAAATVMKGRRK
jgi:hypothetical protein